MNIILRINDIGWNQSLSSLKWKLGPCYGPNDLGEDMKTKWEYNTENSKMIYIDRCCLKPGIYTLICENDNGPVGWGNSFIEIFDQRYCNDFIGHKGLRRVTVAGKQLKYLSTILLKS